MAENNVVTTPDDPKEASTMNPKELAKLKGQLRAQAERTVVQRHQDEYHAEAEKLFADHGLEFTRRLSPKEKAKKEMDQLIRDFPELAEQITAVGAVKEEKKESEGPF